MGDMLFLFRTRSLCLKAGLAGWLILMSPRAARAEDSLSYKFQDYAESGGRIAVRVNSALIEKDLGPLMQLRLMGVIDTITGASPNGRPPATPGGQVPLSSLTERREAWSGEFSRQFEMVKVTAGLAQSRESDYVSRGWSLNTLTDFNQKNTTLLLGVAGTDDDVKVFFQQAYAQKRNHDFIAGVTQLLDARTSVTFNLTFGRATGYLSDPYKLVQKNTEVLPGIFLRQTFNENRPDSRAKWIALAALNHAYPRLNGAVDASYRFHHDDYGITSHTLNLEWFQKLGAKFLLRPGIRFLSQSAADFYHVTLDGGPITPSSAPTGLAPYYSADYRLSALHTFNYGLKLVWTPGDAWQIDATWEKYDMRGRDNVTSPSAYPEAAIVTLGLKFSF